MTTQTRSTMWFFIGVLFFICNSSSVASAEDSTSELRGFDLIYQFGDSLSDTGNLMREARSLLCSNKPYGETAFDKPTGRCSDGFLIIDYFAKAFNLPLLNPFLQRDADFTHGVNFAVAGATSLDAFRYPGAAPTNSSLIVQLEWFRSHLNSACPNSSDCKRRFERALFFMGEVGGNDYNYAFLANNSITNVVSLIPQVIQTISNAVKEVIDHGARVVVVPGNFPIGCIPVYLNNFESNDTTMYDNLGCLREMNEFANLHNVQLKQAIRELQKQFPYVAIYYGDYYSGLTWILRNAASLGFEKDGVFTPCCGNTSQPCWSGEGVDVCSNPKKRISWDGIHLTQEAYRNLAQWLLSNTFRRQHHR